MAGRYQEIGSIGKLAMIQLVMIHLVMIQLVGIQLVMMQQVVVQLSRHGSTGLPTIV